MFLANLEEFVSRSSGRFQRGSTTGVIHRFEGDCHEKKEVTHWDPCFPNSSNKGIWMNIFARLGCQPKLSQIFDWAKHEVVPDQAWFGHPSESPALLPLWIWFLSRHSGRLEKTASTRGFWWIWGSHFGWIRRIQDPQWQNRGALIELFYEDFST